MRDDPQLLPTLDSDLAVLAWLQCSPQLSAGATGFVCDALLQWAVLGGQWPDPVEPLAGRDGDHLQVLVGIVERLVVRAVACRSMPVRFGLARVGRELGNAIRCQQDPAGLAGSRWREQVHRMPWLAGPPAPVVLPDGGVL